MDSLQSKKIILGISGSIAAYKAAFLVRLLIKAGAEVRILMTPAVTTFISPLTLSTLSRHAVLQQVSDEAGWNNHVELGLWADLMIVAPLTANTLAKMSHGICDNIIVAVYLSARCPVYFAPAMDVDMWHHPSTQENVRRLQSFGNHLLPVGKGELASGLIGEGRMAEPEDIVQTISAHFRIQSPLRNMHIVLTAGPTYEPIDPVRFVGNRSSGKMGIALAEAAARRGARVSLILGPSALHTAVAGIDIIRVETAREMYQAATERFANADVGILAAAVSDYRPAEIAKEKIKKSESTLRLEMVKNPDIAQELGQRKKAGQYLIGFALETHNEAAHAFAKLQRKNLDLIVLNSLREKGAGFNGDTNRISIIDPDNKARQFELKSKTAVAEDILDALENIIKPT